jgi:large subunit ribosomal protein L29
MAMAKELREKSAEELTAEEKAARKALFETHYKHANRQLEDTASLKRQRRDLARLLTIKGEKTRADAQKKTEKK